MEEDPFFGKDIQCSPDMVARDVFVNLLSKNTDYKQKTLAKGNIFEETVEHQITTFTFHT